MTDKLLEALANKTTTKKKLFLKVEKDFSLLPTIVSGLSSEKAAIRYGCASILTDLCEAHPKELYPYMDTFIGLLGSRHRILTWNGLAAIANLAAVDTENKLDAIFDMYFGLLRDEYLVTVANVVANSAKIAASKPHLVPEIARRLLAVGEISTTPHLTEECKRVIAEKAIQSFSTFFDRLDDKQKREVTSFAKSHLDSPRKTLQREARGFVDKWGNS